MIPVTSTEYAPCGWSRAQVQQFGAQVGRELGYAPGGDLEPIVKGLGGGIRIAAEEVGAGTGYLEVKGPSDFIIRLSPYSGGRRDRFTIAHELGHYFLHTKMGEIPGRVTRHGTGRLEWEANWFAAGFLMPGELFRELVKKDYGNASLAVHFDVSEAAILVRRETLGL